MFWVDFAALLILITGMIIMTPLLINSIKAYKKAITPAEKPVAEIEADYCQLWEIRRTEKKMVDAGIIKAREMSICENQNCSDCQETRDLMADHLRYEGRRQAIEAKANMRKVNEARRQHQSQAANKMLGYGRFREIGGYRFEVPSHIPNDAKAEFYYDPKYLTDTVAWLWEDSDGHRRVYYERFAGEELNDRRIRVSDIPPTSEVKPDGEKPTTTMCYCPSCNTLNVKIVGDKYGEYCKPCAISQRMLDAEKQNQRERAAKSNTFRADDGTLFRRLSNGWTVAMPPGVPSYAVSKVITGSKSAEVIWGWQCDGQWMRRRTSLATESQNIDTDGNTLYTVTNINDPVTGEYLGSISTNRQTGLSTITNSKGGVIGPRGVRGPVGPRGPVAPQPLKFRPRP